MLPERSPFGESFDSLNYHPSTPRRRSLGEGNINRGHAVGIGSIGRRVKILSTINSPINRRPFVASHHEGTPSNHQLYGAEALAKADQLCINRASEDSADHSSDLAHELAELLSTGQIPDLGPCW